jgi:hypothetical protein
MKTHALPAVDTVKRIDFEAAAPLRWAVGGVNSPCEAAHLALQQRLLPAKSACISIWEDRFPEIAGGAREPRARELSYESQQESSCDW